MALPRAACVPAGYCRARQRLPLEMVSALARETGRLLSQKARSQWLWRGRNGRIVANLSRGELTEEKVIQSSFSEAV